MSDSGFCERLLRFDLFWLFGSPLFINFLRNQVIFDGSTMFVGADVTHPPPGPNQKNENSISAVSRDFGDLPLIYRAQENFLPRLPVVTIVTVSSTKCCTVYKVHEKKKSWVSDEWFERCYYFSKRKTMANSQQKCSTIAMAYPKECSKR